MADKFALRSNRLLRLVYSKLGPKEVHRHKFRAVPFLDSARCSAPAAAY